MSPEVATRVMESYTQIDRATETFQKATGLHCPAGCGQCCESPHVDATPLEMLPLAIALFQQGKAEHWLGQARATAGESPCVFYQPDPAIPGNGRCQVYPWRPTLCRLFGYATVTRKSGTELSVCWRHKQRMPETVAAARQAVIEGLPAPNFAEVALQIANLDPYLGTERMPINQALQVAIEKVGLSLQLYLGSTDAHTA